jgi:Mn2+/Fe2+ NRAMP family transporter
MYVPVIRPKTATAIASSKLFPAALITEFAAVSLALSALGVTPYISVPVFAVALTLMVIAGSYFRWERIVITLCLMDLTWFGLVYVAHPNWSTVAHNTFVPSVLVGDVTSGLVFLIIAVVGTTIAPWQLFSNRAVWRKSVALCGPEVGAAGHADWRDLHRPVGGAMIEE